MAAEALPLGESPAPQTPLAKGQFSLRSLFVFTLRISPLLLAPVLMREFLSGEEPNLLMLSNCLVCTAIYGGIFAAQAEVRRLRRTEKPPGRSILPSICKGGFHGALFFCLAISPAILAQILIAGRMFEQLALLQKFWSPTNVISFLASDGSRLLEFAMDAGFLAFFGFFLGAAGGAVAGAVIEARKR